MKQLFLLGLLGLFPFLIPAQHTFSIVAVDSATGEIGSAGATCIFTEDGAQVISDIVLGVGAIHTQSWWTPVNQNAARMRMQAGDNPDDLISWLMTNDNSSQGGNINDRQYGVVTLNNGSPESAAFTGIGCWNEKGQRLGPGYSIAGNVLLSQDVLDDMDSAFQNTSGPLCDKLMAVMQAAKRPGADSRCLPNGISSGSAFIRVAQPTDTSSAYGDLWLDLNVWRSSGTFNGDPIDELQRQFNDFKMISSVEPEIQAEIAFFPNPTTGILTIQTEETSLTHITVFNVMGQTMLQKQIGIPASTYELELNTLSKGVYYVAVYGRTGLLQTSKIAVAAGL